MGQSIITQGFKSANAPFSDSFEPFEKYSKIYNTNYAKGDFNFTVCLISAK